MRCSFTGSIDSISNKYGYEYIRVAALKQFLFPVLMSLIFAICTYNNFFLLIVFLSFFDLSLAAIIVHGSINQKLNTVGSLVFLGAYTITAYAMMSVVSWASTIFEINLPLLLFSMVFSILLIINMIFLIVNIIRSFRYESIKKKIRNCKLDIYDNKIVGVALNTANKAYAFELGFDEIESVSTIDTNSKQLHNFVITTNKDLEHKLALSNNVGAREEIKYIIKEIKKGCNPYPKPTCSKCGFYLIDGRCPNCNKPTIQF